MRDLRHAVETGHQVAFDFAEVMLDVEDLVDDSIPSAVDGMAGEPGNEPGACDQAWGPDESSESLEVDSRSDGLLSGADLEAGLRGDHRDETTSGGAPAMAGAGCRRMTAPAPSSPPEVWVSEARSVPRGTQTSEENHTGRTRKRLTPTTTRGKVRKEGRSGKKRPKK